MALALVASFSAATARADVCPAPAYAPAVATVDGEARRQFLARAFDREVTDVDVWSWSWGSVYAAGAVGQGVLLPFTSDKGKRIDLEVGIASTAFGAVSLYGLPLQLTLPLRGARRALDRGDCVGLARAERTLLAVEKDQAFANGIAGHLGNVAVNVVFMLILGVGYHRWPSAALSVGVGIPLGEGNAFTQPHHLTDVLGRYRSGQLDFRGTPGPALPALAWSIAPIVGPHASGAALSASW
jgi:hypothetical protein